jgi:hypothetical protein
MTTSPDSPVESYLDAMFDRLAGTGPAGRRLLVDAETHLLERVAANRERGLGEVEAEQDAVARFGLVDDITRRVPVPAGSISVGARRVLIGGWRLVGAGLLWYGLAGLVTWLVGWPVARLRVGTHQFSPWSACGANTASAECLREVHASFGAVPFGGARFPYPMVAVIGALVLIALLVLRRTTRLGTPMWTPPRAYTALAFAVPFSVIGALLVFYGVNEIVDTHFVRLSYVVAGVLALAVTAAAFGSRGPASRRVDSSR